MYSVETLTINGYLNKLVAHTFFRCEAETDHLAILFPGLRYMAEMPLLYYPRRLLGIMGADVLSADIYGSRADFEALESEEQKQWLLTDATAIYQAAVSQRSYNRLTFIGKSIGTLSIGHLLTTEAITAPAQAIWLTPLIRNENLRQQILQSRLPSLFVIGTADPYYDPTYLAEIQEKAENEVMTIEGADHGLSIEDDVLKSIQVLEQVMRVVEVFLTQP